LKKERESHREKIKLKMRGMDAIRFSPIEILRCKII